MHWLIKVNASGKILQPSVFFKSSTNLGLNPARTSYLYSSKIEKDSAIDFALIRLAFFNILS